MLERRENLFNKKNNRTICFFLFLIITYLCFLPISYSEISYNATVSITPQLAAEEYIWVFGSDDFIHKLNKFDLEGLELLVWDTYTGFLFGGCDFRLENGTEYIYIIDSGRGSNSDMLLRFNTNNGSKLSSWDISGFSSSAQGLVWNGSRWFIADSRDDLIYQVDPAFPTVFERSFSYDGQRSCGGLAWDGSYLWAVDYGTDNVYQMDIYGNVETSWSFTPLNPLGATYDIVSGNLWIVSRSGVLYEYQLDGEQVSSWDLNINFPKGIAYSSP